MLLVTGGAGFIGSNFVLSTIAETGETVVNLDKLTYAGNLRNLDSLRGDRRHAFVHGDICDREMVRKLLSKHKPRAVVHFAAESHVDRSIAGPAAFVQTNVVGTFCLLEESRSFYESLAGTERERFRFLHVSTDEVYGSLGPNDPAFTETNRHAPNSPYAASKAAADHLVRSYHHTYGLPTLTTNCSNNYGPYQFPEKLIPLMIRNALAGKPLPVYGDGKNVRDWLFVLDHCDAVRRVLEGGVYADPSVAPVLATGTRVAGTDNTPRELSAREVEVLQLVADGQSNKEIGEELSLSALTVKSHLSRIGRKLGTGDRAQMVALAMRAGVIR